MHYSRVSNIHIDNIASLIAVFHHQAPASFIYCQMRDESGIDDHIDSFHQQAHYGRAWSCREHGESLDAAPVPHERMYNGHRKGSNCACAFPSGSKAESWTCHGCPPPQKDSCFAASTIITLLKGECNLQKKKNKSPCHSGILTNRSCALLICTA